MKKTEVIPFGKYKNQPLEVLSQDPQYMEWLTQQDWFKSRYQNIYTLVVNNFGTPQDTPEHNKLVSLFLNDDFLHKIANRFDYTFCIDKSIKYYEDNYKHNYKHNYRESRDTFNNVKSMDEVNDELEKKKKNLEYVLENKDKGIKVMKFNFPDFESSKGSDVRLDIFCDIIFPNTDLTIEGTPKKTQNSIYYDRIELLIECKPVVGEDFPSVIRQCRTQKSNVLIIDEFTATSVTIEQVRKMFPDIVIILLNEIINDTARITNKKRVD